MLGKNLLSPKQCLGTSDLFRHELALFQVEKTQSQTIVLQLKYSSKSIYHMKAPEIETFSEMIIIKVYVTFDTLGIFIFISTINKSNTK